MEKIDKEIINKIWNKYGNSIFVFIGILGVFLIFAGENATEKEKNIQPVSDTDQYLSELENNLCSLLSSVDGAGEVKIMITLESGQENVFAWQEKSTEDIQSSSADKSGQTRQHTSYENEIVMIENGADDQALVEKVLQPVVQGAIIVCEGADDIRVVSNITNAVSVALNIPSNRICVIKME